MVRWFFALLVVPLASSAAELPFKLDGGNTLQLCADAEKCEIRAAVTPGEFVVKKGEIPKVIEVTFNNVRREDRTKWFVPKWDPAAGKPSALILDVSNDLKQAGTYNVVLE